MFDTFRGLPVHALVVHAVVVLVPLAAIGLIAIAVRPSWRRAYAPVVVILATAGLALVPVATRSGAKLEERLNAGGVVAQQIEDHEEMAKLVIWPTLAMWIVAVTLLVMDRARPHRPADDRARRRRRRGRAGRRRSGRHRRRPRVDGRLEVHRRPLLTGQSSSGASRLRSNRRREASRAGSLCPAATQSSRAHSGSSWLHDRGQSAVPSARSGNAWMTRSRSMCASPKLRRPGVSMTQPPPGSSRAMADDDVCRPRPVTALTPPVARPAPGTSALTIVDLPTPE